MNVVNILKKNLRLCDEMYHEYTIGVIVKTYLC